MTEVVAEVSEALKSMPVSWLHLPVTAAAAIPATRDGAQPKIGPLLAAAIGVAAGAGIQITAQQLSKAGPAEAWRGLEVSCSLTYRQIEENASHIYTQSMSGKDGGMLKAIADGASNTKALPLAAAAFLAGVAAGAAAARP